MVQTTTATTGFAFLEQIVEHVQFFSQLCHFAISFNLENTGEFTNQVASNFQGTGGGMPHLLW
jgi:hypothetical protein